SRGVRAIRRHSVEPAARGRQDRQARERRRGAQEEHARRAEESADAEHRGADHWCGTKLIGRVTSTQPPFGAGKFVPRKKPRTQEPTLEPLISLAASPAEHPCPFAPTRTATVTLPRSVGSCARALS